MSSLDKAWGKLVRERDCYCVYCGGPGIQAHHVFGRGRYGTRFVVENGISLCSSHHVFNDDFSAHKTPEKFKRWIKKYWGIEKYKRLEKMSLQKTTQEKERKKFQESLSTLHI